MQPLASNLEIQFFCIYRFVERPCIMVFPQRDKNLLEKVLQLVSEPPSPQRLHRGTRSLGNQSARLIIFTLMIVKVVHLYISLNNLIHFKYTVLNIKSYFFSDPLLLCSLQKRAVASRSHPRQDLPRTWENFFLGGGSSLQYKFLQVICMAAGNT